MVRALPQKLMMFIMSDSTMGVRESPWARKMAQSELYSPMKG